MLGRALRSTLVVTTLAVALLGIAQPVFADTELGHTGTVGVHSLNDTSASPGAICKYHYLSSYQFGRLRRITVQPPNMMAVAGKSAQTVGWEFIVERKSLPLGPPTPWKKRYTSPEMTAVTSDSHNAAFSSAYVGVKVPAPPGAEDGARHIYRVTVKMFWHRGDGSVMGSSRHRVDFYRIVESNGGTGEQDSFCDGYDYNF
jgi:hypothetical protein